MGMCQRRNQVGLHKARKDPQRRWKEMVFVMRLRKAQICPRWKLGAGEEPVLTVGVRHRPFLLPPFQRHQTPGGPRPLSALGLVSACGEPQTCPSRNPSFMQERTALPARPPAHWGVILPHSTSKQNKPFWENPDSSLQSFPCRKDKHPNIKDLWETVETSCQPGTCESYY